MESGFRQPEQLHLNLDTAEKDTIAQRLKILKGGNDYNNLHKEDGVWYVGNLTADEYENVHSEVSGRRDIN